jgi:hypothetical protein
MAAPSRSGTVYINQEDSYKDEDEGGLYVDKNRDREIDNLVKRSKLIIFETNSKLPILIPFKNKITITPNRVTITYNGLLARDEYPMPIENVTGARVYQDFMFATLYIDTFGIAKPDPLKYLRTTDARLARRYILALIEAKKANADLPVDNVKKLREALKEMGTVRFGTDSEEYHRI